MVLALIAATTVAVVHLRDTQEQRLLTERTLASMHLTAAIEATDGALDADGVQGVWRAHIRLGSAEDFRLLAVTLDEHAWKVDPAALPQAASTTQLVAVTFAGSCAQVEQLATPTRLRVSGRRPGGQVINRTVDLDAAPMLELPRRSCGLADFASSLESEVLGGDYRTSFAIVDLQLRNRSRHPGRVTAIGLRDALVTTRQLPIVLPPSAVGHPAPLVRVHLTVRYLRCTRAAEDTELNLQMLDDAGGSSVHVVTGLGPAGPLLGQLANGTCRQ